MKVLNLYAGIGGNRKLWEDVEVTAVEWDEETAKVYSDYFPDDTMIVGDAHQYLLDHYKEFDFIWTSPPCPTHSKIRKCSYGDKNPVYPDMNLYQEIILLDNYFKGIWVVENVVSFYEPLIPAKEIARHLFWASFKIGHFEKGKIKGNPVEKWSYKDYEDYYGYDLSDYSFSSYERRKRMRNMVDPDLGLHILNAARNIITKSNTEQTQLF